VATLAAACGSSGDSSNATVSTNADDPVETEAPDPAATATTAVDPTTTTISNTTAGDPTTTAPAESSTTEPAVDPEDVPFPGAALPILAVHETPQALSGLEAVGGALFSGAGVLMIRVDVDTGDQTEVLIPEEQDVEGQVFYPTRSGSHVVIATQSRSIANIDHVTALASDSLERGATLRLPVGQSAAPMPSIGESTETSSLVFRGEWPNVSQALFELDTETMTLGLEPLPYDVGDGGARATRVDGHDWVWRLDGSGSVYDATDGSEVSSFDLGYGLGVLQHDIVASDEASIWHADLAFARLSRFDRETRELTDQVDLSEHFGPDAIVRLSFSDIDSSYVIAHVQVDDDGWYVLLDLDLETGAVRSQHVISGSAFEFGWTGPQALPEVQTIGDRVFVTDHRRRIVEVDAARLGQASPTAWEFSGLATAPVLTPEEQELADLMISDVELLQSDAGRIASTDPELTALEGRIAVGTGAVAGGLEPLRVTIDGDRAWGWMHRTDNEGIGIPYTFVRVDDQWLLDADAMCLFVWTLGNVCQITPE
jgi:hypothetical protein